MPSFDVVSEANMVEVRNAVDQTNKEIGTRFDFRGSDARVEQKEHELTVFADSEFQLGQVKDVLTGKMAKRKVDIRFLDEGKIEKISGDKVKQLVTVKNGIASDQAKKIVKLVKDNKLKVQTLGRGFAWLDTGTHDSLAEASTYIEVIEKRQGLKVACLEGIAYRKGWISADKMRELARPMLKNQYGQYLLKVVDEVERTGMENLD